MDNDWSLTVFFSSLAAEVNILAESNSAQISATISFRQDSPDAPLRIEGHISGLPQGQHGFHVHQNGDTSDQCMAAGPHFNPTQVRVWQKVYFNFETLFFTFRPSMEVKYQIQDMLEILEILKPMLMVKLRLILL